MLAAGFHDVEASNRPKVLRGTACCPSPLCPCSCLYSCLNAALWFVGIVCNWPAAKLWQGHAGLNYLSQLAGEAQVQAMQNDKQDSLFFGDMRQFTPSNCSFATFLSSARQRCKPSDTPCADTQHHSSQYQAYLAQASMDSAQPLHKLQQDIDVPEAIRHTDILHTNLWMNFRYLNCLHASSTPLCSIDCLVQCSIRLCQSVVVPLSNTLAFSTVLLMRCKLVAEC